MSKIKKIKAREILDSRGNPTIEVDLIVKNMVYSASVPSGASTGTHEALELRDNTKRYLGKGVQKAVRNVDKISKFIVGKDCNKQENIDNLMIRKDGTDNKSKYGANAILAVSLACARAGANNQKLFLFEHIAKLLNPDQKELSISLPKPFFNVINGGKHAENVLPFQEFMIVPKAKSFKESLRMGSEIYHYLKIIIEKKYGKNAANVGDEGGFAPPIKKAEEALELLKMAIKKAGYVGKVNLAMDCAASEFYKNKHYFIPRKITTQKLIEYYIQLAKKYPIISIEDPFDQEDFIGFGELRKKLAENKLNVQIVGDDLTVTNVDRIEEAIREGSCDCLLLKVNQIGSLTEALDAVRLAYQNNWKVMVSHRSGETEDTFIADLAVGINCGQIKAGAPCRGERTAKYNQLLRIEELLSKK
jgi:enolase